MKKRKNKKETLTFESLEFPSYEEVRIQIDKIAGERPELPKELPPGAWTDQAIKVLDERYLMKNADGEIVEKPDEMCWRIAWEIASADARWGKTRPEIIEIAKVYYKLLASHEFLPNSPTLMNAGTRNMLQYSGCFVVPVEDSLIGIFDALKYQALIHQTGGGTGFSFSRLRPKGSMVKSSHGTASGPVSFMRIFDAATNEIKQGGRRRGANMGILRVDHPDILDFIHCKKDGGITNFNISVAITDKFMEAYEKDKEYELVNPKDGNTAGKLSARKVFQEIAQSAWETGDPGLVFIDRINKGMANPVPSLGPIESTNPCVAGDTFIYTKNGLRTIKDLVNEGSASVLVDSRLSDNKFHPARIFATGIKPVYKLLTKEGYEVKLTKDHRLLTNCGWQKVGELKKGDRILISSRSGGFGTEGTEEEGQILGWLVGDGTMKAAEAVLSFFGQEKQILAPKFARMVNHLVDGMQILQRDYNVGVNWIPERNEARVGSTRLWRYAFENGISPYNKLKVPVRVLTGTKKMQAGFLTALFTADGHVEGNADRGLSARLTSTSPPLLKDVQRLLLNFGIASKIYTNRRNESYRDLPDGKGGRKSYLCKAYHDLAIAKENLWLFAKEVGFLVDYKNAKLIDALREYSRGTYNERYEASFERLVYLGSEPVYDITEPSTHSFIANGFVSHNCGEQPLYPFDSCNLGSIFLTYFTKEENGKKEVDWDKLKLVTRLSVRFLDGVVEVNPYTIPQIRKTTLAIRRIGLGVGGWADMLIDLNIAYDSEEALVLAEKIMKVVQKEAEAESTELAKERRPFPLWPISIYKSEAPRRNSSLTTIAPTGTISIIAGASSGIEPIFAIAYQHIVKDKHIDRRLAFFNPKFESVAKERAFWSEEVKEKVAVGGVIRHIEEIPEDIKKIFGTAHEIEPFWHVKMQSAFQKYTDNAVSKTINLRSEATIEDVKNAYLTAWNTKCKGITVFRDGCKDMQVLNLGVHDKELEKEDVSIPLRERPVKVMGATYKLSTPVGSAFITINQDENGDPLEIFINVGKAGSDVAAMAEALGRTISTALRFKGSLNPKDKAKEIAHQLSGIGGRRSVGFGPNRVRSLPDAISSALALHYGFKINGNGHTGATSNVAGAVMAAVSSAPAEQTLTGLLDPTMASAPFNGASVNGNGYYQNGHNGSVVGGKLTEAPLSIHEEKNNNANYEYEVAGVQGDICPVCGSSALVYEEGCSKCHACGHSEC